MDALFFPMGVGVTALWLVTFVGYRSSFRPLLRSRVEPEGHWRATPDRTDAARPSVCRNPSFSSTSSRTDLTPKHNWSRPVTPLHVSELVRRGLETQPSRN